MARPALVLDASVGVKWYSDKNERDLPQAMAIRQAHLAGQILIAVPDLFYYEVANALIHKRFIPTSEVQSALSALFALDLSTVTVNSQLLIGAASLARELNVTVYDAAYIATAGTLNIPLVTSNPRHQKPGAACEVILLDHWRLNPL